MGELVQLTDPATVVLVKLDILEMIVKSLHALLHHVRMVAPAQSMDQVTVALVPMDILELIAK
jgi:hypothetical protein